MLTPRRIVIIGLWAAVLVAGLASIWFRSVEPWVRQEQTAELGLGDYNLVTTEGGAFTEASLEGGATAVFFGFTHCPDVCPTTLGDVATWQENLSEQGRDLRVFFFSVDPERDTPDILQDYVGWVPGVVGVTGDPEEMKKAIKSFKIYANKVPLSDGDYTMDHSASVLLFDKNGHFFGLIGYQEGEEKSMATLNRLFDAI